MLRLYLQARPRATSAIQKAAGFGGASYIGLSLSSAPIRIEGSKSNATMAAQEGHDAANEGGGGGGGGQKAMLASQRAKEQQPQQQQGQEAGKISRWFPLTASEGFSQWWAGQSPMATEHRVLSFIPHLQKPPTHTDTGAAATDPAAPPKSPEAHTTTDSATDPHGPRRWNSQMVELSGKGRALNEFSVERLGEDVDENLVMLHGYGAGLGFFYRNFESLSRAEGWKVYALDLLGMGRSSRPNFKIHAKDKQAKIDESESWFIDALEEWRVKRGIDKFTLLGHSLGGYLAVAYALKYPGHLNKLILASPVGIPEDPTPPKSTTASSPPTADNNNFMNQRKKNENAPAKRPAPPTPTQLAILPLGSKHGLALYIFTLSFASARSSEYALAYLLAPGAFARSPLIRRIQGVGRQHIQSPSPTTADTSQSGPKENGIPIVFMYGENDWMDVAGGYAAQEKIKQERALLSPEEKKKDQGDAKVIIINKAGHHVYLDGWEQFNKVMLEEMDDVKRRKST
ncbi:hypothetical protein SNOG_06088 [Parastagonospora nodorum SN15]|uniref:AB hydrolase-1 domain-containing protein n=1 Tax=Phaeosphaeria nodorum (strain SN15 / ATCC MYA-4574 / FGSC 10173) TaxID=321614 RepID=Q0UQ76_PHANO|nr:hypothetical protein SNOG_06088 [Parastagonospora nodorum SN15]EAT87152.2 hypothetical protein SNOG_06088 [Parastagonospora nodorum SN15]